MRRFSQVDVFTAEPYRGNPVAVIHDADDLSTAEMHRIANWTNLSETTFLLSPTDPGADYRVRIFTPALELPFAGHPTIGTCHAWLEAGGSAVGPTIVQECAAGLVTLRRSHGRLAFAAPPLIKSGAPTEAEVARACRILCIEPRDVIDARWCDNGPGWIGLRLPSVDAVLALDPDLGAELHFDIGVWAFADSNTDSPTAIELRAFFRSGGTGAEDPVTGSLNAAVAQWVVGDELLDAPYVAAQGTALGRAGRIHVDTADGEIWVGGDAVTCVTGEIAI